MTLSSPWAAVALATCLFPPDAPDASGLPAPQPGVKCVEAVLGQWSAAITGSTRRQPEHVAMLDAILEYKAGPGMGWFKPGEGRLGWRWLAGQMDADRDGQITREEFRGSDAAFERLDRNGDGVLTEADFVWPYEAIPANMPKAVRIFMSPPQDMLLKAFFRGEMGSWYEGPRVGQRAPLFNLPTQDGKRTVALADLLGDKPVVLIFGSFT